jgi:alkyl hydroperoxide reductase subunit D
LPTIKNLEEICMSIDALIDDLPGYAKDLKLNYSSLVRNNTELAPQQLWGAIVASALATRSAALTTAVLDEAQVRLTPLEFEAARAAAAIMGMNNIYYRFQHLSTNEKYATLPARLRMNVMRTHGIDPLDFELYGIAVSAINGCGKCVDAHEKIVREKGASEETVLAVVRIASLIHAIGAVVDAEAAAADVFASAELVSAQ